LDREELISSMIMELRRGTIILGVLSQLNEPVYGYNLVNILSDCGMTVEANTLYPLLRRLEGQGILSSRWETEDNSKPRKYYVITDFGKEIYHAMSRQWSDTVSSMKELMERSSL